MQHMFAIHPIAACRHAARRSASGRETSTGRTEDALTDAQQIVRYDDRRAILLFADTQAALEEGTALIEQMLGDRARGGLLDDAVRLLDHAIAPDAVLVNVQGEGGAALDRLLERLDAAARRDRLASVVCLSHALIDLTAARTFHPWVDVQVDEPMPARALALELAVARGRVDLLVAEERGQPADLLQLSEEVGRIARTLAALSAAGTAAEREPSRAAEGVAAPPAASAVRVLIRARRLREQYFDFQLFADPAWDMLLDLFAARLEHRPVAVSSLCIAAAVPPTTALRWIKQLTDVGLFVRVADPRDGRRVFIELADPAAAALAAYFHALKRIGVGLP